MERIELSINDLDAFQLNDSRHLAHIHKREYEIWNDFLIIIIN